MRVGGHRFGFAVALLAMVGATAGPTSAETGAGDVVNGGFEDRFGEKVGLHARSGPDGEDPSGHESATRPGGTRYRLVVTCLVVDGDVAAYGTRLVQSNNPDFPVGTEFVEVVRDSGRPDGEGDGWDIFDEPADTCADFLGSARSAPDVARGNIVIRDVTT